MSSKLRITVFPFISSISDFEEYVTEDLDVFLKHLTKSAKKKKQYKKGLLDSMDSAVANAEFITRVLNIEWHYEEL